MARIVTTVWSPAAAPANEPGGAYNLVDLTTAKLELRIETDDTEHDRWLVQAIEQISEACRHHCNRVFQVEGITDLVYVDRAALAWREPRGAAPIQLSRWPLAQLVTAVTSADTQSGAVLTFASTPSAVVGDPVSGPNIPAAATVAAVGGGTVTLSVAVLGDVPAGSEIAFGLSLYQLNADLSRTALAYGADFTADLPTAQLYRLDARGRLADWEALPTTVSYWAGYASVPGDVADAALRLLTNRYFSRGRDPYLREVNEPGVGNQIYWVGGPPKSGGLPAEIADLLDRYRVPVTG